MARVQYTFKLVDKAGNPLRNVDIASITIRETDGKDEDAAFLAAKAKGGGTTQLDEQVRLAIVSVDGKPAQQPFGDVDSWNSRTRAFVYKAFTTVNGVEPGEMGDFLSGAILSA